MKKTAIYELKTGVVHLSSVNCDEETKDFLVKIEFTRYADGKLFEADLTVDVVTALHGIFFDPFLICDIFSMPPLDITFRVSSADSEPETATIVWEFGVVGARGGVHLSCMLLIIRTAHSHVHYTQTQTHKQ